MNRWLMARTRASQVRQIIEDKKKRELYGEALVDAIIENEDLTWDEVPATDSLLKDEEGNSQARYYAEERYIVIQEGLSVEQRILLKAHELGHHFLHTRKVYITGAVDPAEVVLTLPYAEGRIATYSAHQAQEHEATIFACELIVPSGRVAVLFDAGTSIGELLTLYQTTRSILFAQLATALLIPTLSHAESIQADEDPFHWTNLADSQKQACCAPTGPVIVEAGPGTGKTRTLTSRIQWLIEENHVPPERILALTFSNKATEELRLRLRKVLPTVAHQVTVTTFHGFGLELLRRYAHLVNLPAGFMVLDPLEAEMLLEAHLNELDLVEFSDPSIPARFISDLLEVIAAAKEELLDSAACIELLAQHISAHSSLITDDNQAQYQEAVHVYSKYQEILQRNGLVDYGDLVLLPMQLLRNAPDVLQQLLAQYPHILVDEFQDINRANGELVKLLAGTDGLGLWVVGDIRQSIYRWRGATPVYLQNFQGMFPRVASHFLDTNYRSSAPLTSFISHVASAMNLPAPPRPWQAYRPNGATNPISVAVADDKHAELLGICEEIQQHVQNGLQYEDIAILCRKNDQTAEIATFLTKAGIPVLHLGNFLLRPEIKDLLAVLSLVTDTQSVTWPRIAALLQEPVSIEFAMKLWHETDMKSKPFPVAATTALTSLSQLQQKELREFLAVVGRHVGQENANTWWVLCEFLFEQGSYLRRLRASGGRERQQALLAIAQLLNIANAHSRRKIVGQDQAMIPAFLNYIRHMTKRNQREVDLPIEIEVNAVRILTIHKAKGLEFPVIFVPNLAKGRFPARLRDEQPTVPSLLLLRGGEVLDDELLEEESCLFVAVTRAQDQLVLSRAKSYHRRLGKPVTYEKSVLWRLLEPSVVAVNSSVRHVSWSFPASGSGLTIGDTPGDRHYDQLDLSAISTYQRCPRQFYYRYVLGLSVHEERGIYLHFHIVVSRAIDWLLAQATQQQFLDWPQVAAYLETELQENLPQQHAHSEWYHRLAMMQLQNLWNHIHENRRQLTNWRTQVLSQYSIGNIGIQFVIAEVFEDAEKCNVTIFRTGKRRKSHLTHPLPVLSRQALQTQTYKPIHVYLHYLSTNEVVEVPTSVDAKVLRELHETVEDIRRGYFSPSPKGGGRPEQNCSNCRYLFLCEGYRADA